MIRLDPSDLKDLGILKHYRIVRKWAYVNNDLMPADLDLLIYFDCMGYFSKKDFQDGCYSYAWQNRKWNRLLKNGWIDVWRPRNHTTQKYNIYKVSFKGKQLISRMYRMMLGKENIPTSQRNRLMSGKRDSDAFARKSIENANSDKTLNNEQYD